MIVGIPRLAPFLCYIRRYDAIRVVPSDGWHLRHAQSSASRHQHILSDKLLRYQLSYLPHNSQSWFTPNCAISVPESLSKLGTALSLPRSSRALSRAPLVYCFPSQWSPLPLKGEQIRRQPIQTIIQTGKNILKQLKALISQQSPATIAMDRSPRP